MKTIRAGQKGFTLIEVLASIGIMGLILLVFFGFYAQSMLFSSKNEKQLEALNIAREVQAKIQQGINVESELTNIRGNVVYYITVSDITPAEMKDLSNPDSPPFSLYTKEISVYSSAAKSGDTLLAKTFGYKKGGP